MGLPELLIVIVLVVAGIVLVRRLLAMTRRG
jgi:hypothetical protein